MKASIFLGVGLVVALVTGPPGRNVLDNGGFEKGAPDEPNGWRKTFNPQLAKGLTFVRDSKSAKEGKWSARITNEDPSNKTFVSFTQRLSDADLQDLTGKTVELSGVIRTEGAAFAAIWFQVFGEGDADLLRLECPDGGATGTAAWKRVSAKAEVPAGGTGALARVVIRGKGTAWFDDVALRVVEGPKKPGDGSAEKPEARTLTPAQQAFRRAFSDAFVATDPSQRADLATKAVQAGASLSTPDAQAAIAAGPALDANPTGHVTDLSFDALGETWRYAMVVPASYKPDRQWPLLLLPGHPKAPGEEEGWAVEGITQALVVRAAILDALNATPRYEQLVQTREGCGTIWKLYDALLEDVSRRYAVDPDRVYVTGLSMTGFWSWELGALSPSRFAAIAPFSAVTWQVENAHANFRNLPVFIAHAEKDSICPVRQARDAAEALRKLGCTVEYVEVAGGAHTDTVPHRGRAGRWMLERRREICPKAFEVRVLSPEVVDHYWLTVTRFEGFPKDPDPKRPVASLEAKVEPGNRVVLKTENVAGLQVHLDSRLVDLGKPVTVVWNGREAFKGAVSPSVESLVSTALRGMDCGAAFPVSVPIGRGDDQDR